MVVGKSTVYRKKDKGIKKPSRPSRRKKRNQELTENEN